MLDVAAFALAAGGQLALRGESGSGKTTFLHLIAGILTADGGTLTLAGNNLVTLGEAQRDRLQAALDEQAPSGSASDAKTTGPGGETDRSASLLGGDGNHGGAIPVGVRD